MPVQVTLSDEFSQEVIDAVYNDDGAYALHLCRQLLEHIDRGYHINHIVYPANSPYDWAAAPPNVQHYDDHPAGTNL